MGDNEQRVVVYHGGFGCGTGCCGHWVSCGKSEKFDFTHQEYRETREEFVERLVTEMWGAEHVADIDWSKCVVVDD